MGLIAICLYLVGALGALLYFLLYLITPEIASAVSESTLIVLRCGAIGGLGGVVYCIRGVYLNKCVRKCWDSDWYVWYLLRPLASCICGGVAFLFMKAGLLLLDASKDQTSNDVGLYALAFIAGLNVDKFLQKIEDIGNAAWGIEKSRTANTKDDKGN